ncbi:hypothetical protein [Caballeronia glebae]|uniref:hypothetical protein n=1 Tax=Caballeronia glebae TaxID=1777143 RepID=UPI001F349C48|nr:hypothetical protein [Caballeronia glebae]
MNSWKHSKPTRNARTRLHRKRADREAGITHGAIGAAIPIEVQVNILFPHVDSVYVGEGLLYFDAIVDGVTVNCVLTEHALSAATGVDQIMSRREAFAFGQPAIMEIVARRATDSAVGPIVITRAEFRA